MRRERIGRQKNVQVAASRLRQHVILFLVQRSGLEVLRGWDRPSGPGWNLSGPTIFSLRVR